MLHLTLLTFVQLAEDGEKFGGTAKARQDFPRSKILHISYKDHVTNEKVRAKIQQAIGPHEDLLTIVKRRKLQWYGHVSRSSGLAKKKHLARGSERGKKTRKTEEAVGRQHQGMDRPGVRQVPEGS